MNGARVKASSVISAANGTDDTGEVEEMRQLVRKDSMKTTKNVQNNPVTNDMYLNIEHVMT